MSKELEIEQKLLEVRYMLTEAQGRLRPLPRALTPEDHEDDTLPARIAAFFQWCRNRGQYQAFGPRIGGIGSEPLGAPTDDIGEARAQVALRHRKIGGHGFVRDYDTGKAACTAQDLTDDELDAATKQHLHGLGIEDT